MIREKKGTFFAISIEKAAVCGENGLIDPGGIIALSVINTSRSLPLVVRYTHFH